MSLSVFLCFFIPPWCQIWSFHLTFFSKTLFFISNWPYYEHLSCPLPLYTPLHPTIPLYTRYCTYNSVYGLRITVFQPLPTTVF
ncbi:hypothetical protein B484DRAFT_460105 [Ochromonadaceae sp. CCMP2298]|nr:hypothetical protein B484DRAFT_460105 [Ochromonadaceae sp. CCMP2298]